MIYDVKGMILNYYSPVAPRVGAEGLHSIKIIK